MTATPRVVITGVGLISPLGNSPQTLWEGLTAGTSGVRRLESIAVEGLPFDFGAEAWDFQGKVEEFGVEDKQLKRTIKKALRLMCREIQMGVAAAQLAISHAGVKSSEAVADRAGVVFGSDYIMTAPHEFTDGMKQCQSADGEFQFDKWGELGIKQTDPLWLLKYLPNMPASHIAINNDFRGPSNSLTMREAAPNLAIGEAYATIQRGWADFMVAGATGTRLHDMRTVYMTMQEPVSISDREPNEVSRPFDRDRSGMVFGEGAGAVMLETLDSAQERGATIYGEVIGHASSSVADSDRHANRKKAMVNAMKAALRLADLEPQEIGHIHAHGLSTLKGDIDEAAAILEVFGRSAPPLVAAKANFGNLGCGGGAVECIASILAIHNGELFPLINYQTPDPSCPINPAVSGEASGDSFLNLNTTPHGQASAVIVRKLA